MSTRDVAPPRARKPSSGGLFLAGLVVVLLMLPPVGGYGWRERGRQQLRRNHREAHRVLFDLARLEAAFKQDDLDRNGVSDYWTGDVAGLMAAMPDRGGRPDWVRIARADPSRPDAEPHCGYWFLPIDFDVDGAPYRVHGQPRHPSAFGFCAFPAEPGRTGQYVFILNQEGQIFSNWDVRARPTRWPAKNVLVMQWSKPG
jgi:hypothetical protein